MELLAPVLLTVAVTFGLLVLLSRLRRRQVESRSPKTLFSTPSASTPAPDPSTYAPVSTTPARYASPTSTAAPAHEYDPYGIRVGDHLQISGVSGVVVATIGCLEDVYAWTSFCLGVGPRREWFTAVSERHGVEVVRWRRMDAMPAEPTATEVTVEGTTYLYEEAGTARFEAHGEVDLPASGTVEYVDLHAGPKRLSFESYNGSPWEASIGEIVPAGDLVRRA